MDKTPKRLRFPKKATVSRSPLVGVNGFGAYHLSDCLSEMKCFQSLELAVGGLARRRNVRIPEQKSNARPLNRLTAVSEGEVEFLNVSNKPIVSPKELARDADRRAVGPVALSGIDRGSTTECDH
jgi:hypothetical protein